MSRFTHALSKLITADFRGVASHFAEHVHLPQPTVHRWLNSENACDREKLECMRRYLAPEQYVPLVYAWLDDQIPGSAREWIQLTLISRTDSGRDMPRYPTWWHQLDPETQAALEKLALLSIDGPNAPHVRAALISTFRFLSDR